MKTEYSEYRGGGGKGKCSENVTRTLIGFIVFIRAAIRTKRYGPEIAAVSACHITVKYCSEMAFTWPIIAGAHRRTVTIRLTLIYRALTEYISVANIFSALGRLEFPADVFSGRLQTASREG